MMMDNAARPVHQQHSHIPVARLADAEQFRLAAGRMLARHKSEIGGKLPSVLESLRLADRSDDSGGDQCSDAGNGGELLADRMRFENCFDFLVDGGRVEFRVHVIRRARREKFPAPAVTVQRVKRRTVRAARCESG